MVATQLAVVMVRLALQSHPALLALLQLQLLLRQLLLATPAVLVQVLVQVPALALVLAPRCIQHTARHSDLGRGLR